MFRTIFISAFLVIAIGASSADELRCGTVPTGHQGDIQEWPNAPVEFACNRGASELTLCILNRKDVEWLPNTGPDFVAIYDGDAIYALTRDTHPAHPMIVRRKLFEDNEGHARIQSTACGYGDKAASDQLMAEYQELDESIADSLTRTDKDQGVQ